MNDNKYDTDLRMSFSQSCSLLSDALAWSLLSSVQEGIGCLGEMLDFLFYFIFLQTNASLNKFNVNVRIC